MNSLLTSYRKRHYNYTAVRRDGRHGHQFWIWPCWKYCGGL